MAIVNEPRPQALPRWRLSALGVGLGLILTAVGLWAGHQAYVGSGNTESAAAELQVQVNQSALAAQGAVRGQAASIKDWAQAQNRAQETWVALSHGVGTTPALSSAEQNRLTAVWGDLQPLWSHVQDSMRGLDSAARALAQLPSVEQALRQAKEDMARQSGLANWVTTLAPVQADLDRADAPTLEAVFDPVSPSATAQQWANVLAQRANDADRLLANLGQDTNVSTAGRRALNEWANQVHQLSQIAQVLVASQPYRVLVQKDLPALQAQTDRWNEAVGQTRQALAQTRSGWSWGEELAGLGVLLALTSALVWFLGTATLARLAQQWADMAERQQSLADHVERLTRRVRRMGDNWASTGVMEPLEEDSAAPTYALASLVGRVLQQQQEQLDKMQSHWGTLGQQWAEQGQLWRQVIAVAGQDHDMSLPSRMAESMAVLAGELSRGQQQVQGWQAHSEQAQTLLQEGLWRTDALRETIQSSAKRLKRLGESSQNMGAGTEVLHELSRRIQVLAVTGVIEAASAGEQGRSLGALAQEIEDLAKNAGLVTQDIERLLDELRKDAQETAAAMEHSTAEVVASSRLVGEASEVLQQLEAQTSEQKETGRRQVSQVEQQALVASQLQQNWAAQHQQMGQIKEWGEAARAQVDTAQREWRAIGAPAKQ